MRVISLNPEYDRSDAVRRIQFAPDGGRFAALVGEARFVTTVSVWDIAADRELHNERTDAGSGLDEYADPAVSPDLTRIAYHAHQDTAGVDYITVVTVGNGPMRELGEDDEDYVVRCLGFSPDGQTLAAGIGRDGGPLLAQWDLDILFGPGRQVATVAEGEPMTLPDWPTCMAFHPDGEQFAVGTASGVILVGGPELRKPRSLRRPVASKRATSVDGLAFSPDGRFLASRIGGVVNVWDANPRGTGKPLGELTAGKKTTDPAFSPDGRTLAAASGDGTVTFWSVGDGFAERVRFDWKLGPLTAVAFAPDGLTCAAGADRGRVVIWDVDF